MPEPELSDRRPLKTRSWRLFQVSASRLADFGISPNAISVASVGFAAIAAIGLVMTGHAEEDAFYRIGWLIAILGIQGRLIANLLDGMVAVEGGRASAVGPLFNEVPDRISDPILLVAAGYAFSGDLNVGWAAALVALFVAYTRAIIASVGCGQSFVGPMAKQHRMALLSMVCVAGVLFPRQWMMLGGWGLMHVALWVIVIGGIITAIRRLVWSAEVLKSKCETDS